MLHFDEGGGGGGGRRQSNQPHIASKHRNNITKNHQYNPTSSTTTTLLNNTDMVSTKYPLDTDTISRKKRRRRTNIEEKEFSWATASARPMAALLSPAAVVVLLAVIGSGASAKGTYSVLAPSVLRPNRDYSVVASAHNTEGPLRLGVEVMGNLQGGGAKDTFTTRQEVVVQPDSSQLVKFQMGDLSAGDYHLSISGTGGGLPQFRNITALRFEPKSYSVFVETDRAVYKPGDLVKFRVVVVNPNLRPSVTGAIDVSVKDGAGTIVKQYPRVFTNKGVWTTDLQLSSEPVLGHWTIGVSVLGQENHGQFFVAEFVDPKFEVSVSLPDYISLDDETLPVTVEASYPYGRPIKGEVTLQVTSQYQYEYLQAPYTAPVSVVRGIRGNTKYMLNLRDQLGLQGDYARQLEVTAYVREELTGRVQNSTASITVYRFPYKMTFIKSSDAFKPGLKYTAYIRVSYQDGRPVTSGEVTVRHAFVRDEAAFVESKHVIPSDGVVTLEVNPPLERPGPSWTLAFEAQYRNLTQWLGEVPRARSPAGAFLQATLLTPQPVVGEEVVVALNSTEKLVYFVYEVLARGDVLHASTLQAHQGNQHTFRFVASGPMFPRARLLVSFVRPDGEVVADSLHFAVRRSPKDKVTLSVTPQRVDVSGDDGRVSISVSARPNSLVGVAAMDTNSLSLMGDHYRMDRSDIVSELETYDPGQTWSGEAANDRFLRRVRGRRAIRKEMAWHGTSTAHDVFQNAGVLLMTNAAVHQEDPVMSGTYLTGAGPIDGRGWDPADLPPAHNGPFGRLPQAYRPDTSTLRPDLGPGLEYDAPPRPPLAGPYAFSFLPPPPDHKPRVYLSQLLPPTWLFTHRQTGLNGILTWQEKLPKTLTSYTLTAFAIDDFDGLTIAESPAVVTAHRPFMVSVRVPSSVVKNEAVAVEVVVFNYESTNATVTVTLHNADGEFLFLDFSNKIDQGSPEAARSRQVTVAGGGGRTPLSFMIVPPEVGPINIKVTAQGPDYTDTSTQTLLVKAEGHRLHVNKAVYIDPSQEPNFNRVLNVTLPRNIVNDSLSIEISAFGDVLGSAVTSLKELLRLPKGCGEQNMASMIPTLITLGHLESVGELSRNLKERAIQDLELRFQQQLTYRQPDGSFAFFDEYRGSKGSTWLTAFVAKTLRASSTFIDVPRDVITKALSWLVKQQLPDGSFVEPSPDAKSSKVRQNGGQDLGFGSGFINSSSSSGAVLRESPLALSSYVLLAILEVEDYSSPAVRNAGNRALEYIISVLQGQQEDATKDPYGLAIATYALHAADHPYRDTAFYMLEPLATVEDGVKWWPSGEPSISTEEGNIVSSLTIEQTSYALLTYARRGLTPDSTSQVTSWLTSRRNALGGFASSQDTAVGLSALSALAQLLATQSAGQGRGTQLTIRLVYGERGHRFAINAGNERVLQKLELPSDTRSIEITADGDHLAIVQLSYSYNVKVTAPRPAFSLDPQLDRTTDSNQLRLTACTALIVRDNTSDLFSNMAVMEVGLPSGYVIDDDALPGLYDYPGVRRVERLQGESSSDPKRLVSSVERGIAIYFNALSAMEVCPTVVASRVDRVAFHKKTVIKVYDYYDLTRQARQFYDAAPATLCDICDVEECDPNTCDVQIAELNRQRQDPNDFEYAATVIETSAAPAPAHPLRLLSQATVTLILLAVLY